MEYMPAYSCDPGGPAFSTVRKKMGQPRQNHAEYGLCRMPSTMTTIVDNRKAKVVGCGVSGRQKVLS